jgi:hypothetical protein
MDESDIGNVFLFACPWDWTYTGRLVGFRGDRLLISEGGYYTRTGATFDRLCKVGFTENTRFHMCGDIRIPNAGPVHPWTAEWPQQPSRAGGRQ